MSTGAHGRPLLAMLMTHDPVLDPRIGWEAASAAEKFDVLAVGLQPPWRGGAAEEMRDGYRIRRLVIRPSMSATAGFVLRWLRVLRWRDRLAVLALLAAGGWLLALIPLIAHGLLWVGARVPPVKSAARAAWARCTVLHPVYDFLHEEINWRFAPATRTLWRQFTEDGLRPAAVHCNDLDTLLVGVLAKRAYGCRLVYDAHEFWPYSRPNAGWYYTAFYRYYERSLIGHCDAVVTVNPMLAHAMASEYGLAGVHSVPNAEPWRGPVAAWSGELTALAAGRVKFLFQGGFAGERGIEEMIRAWQRVDGARAALFLRGPRNPRRDACEALARELGLLGRSVYVLEPVAEEALVAASMEADVGVIPYKPTLINHKYCCPNKLSQFLQAGLMVLANDLPYVKQVVAAAGAGLSFDTREESTVVEAVRRATDDAALRERCGRSGQAYARQAFNWQQFYPVLEAAYLGQRAPAGKETPSCAG